MHSRLPLPGFHFSQACLPYVTVLYPVSPPTCYVPALGATITTIKDISSIHRAYITIRMAIDLTGTVALCLDYSITSIPQGLFVSSHVRLTTTKSGNQGNCSCVRSSSFFITHLISLWTHQGCNNDYKTESISVEQINDSPFHLRGFLQGPQGSPYEGGTFEVVSSTVIFSMCMI